MTSDYVCPPFGSSNDRLIGWLREAVQDGQSWLGAQKAQEDWAPLIARLLRTANGDDFTDQSNAQYNKTERVAREIVAALGAFTNVGEYRPRADKSLYDTANTLTKLDQAWLRTPAVYEAFRSIRQYSVTLGTGYGWQTWDRHYHGRHRGDIRLTALAPQNVTFVQLPADHDLQRAYVVLVREELPINLARRIYASTNLGFAHGLQPDRDAPGWFAKGLAKVQRFVAPALRVRGTSPNQDAAASSFPTVDIFHAYILDGSINETGRPMLMGEPGTNWTYTVPAVGDPIPVSSRGINPATGNIWTRPATPDDCWLFPTRRYVIFARSTDLVAYDGPLPLWHGHVPLARFRFNDWPFEALGRSCVAMIGSMEDSFNAIAQGIEDSIAARLDPPVIYDDNLVSKSFAEAFKPRKAGVRAAATLSQGKVLEFPVPPQYYDVPQWITAYQQYLDGRMDYVTGTPDITAIAKAKQLPSGDAMEKLLEMAGPLVQDMVRSVTMPLFELGQQRLALYLQFYTATRIISSTDDLTDQQSPSDWVFVPDALATYKDDDTVDARTMKSKALVSSFEYRVSQSGISEINRMTTKLFYLQLMKIPGFPMDWWTFANAAQLPQFAPEPENTNNMLTRWVAQQRMQLELQQEFQGAAGGGAKPPGRPPSNKKAPHLEIKDGGTRSTASTS